MTEKIKNLDKILIILLTNVIASYIFFILKVPFINNYSHEEKLLSLISVKNFNEDGLLFTSLLPNYSINKDTTPFVYTHLNDLPSVINYYLLKIYNSEQILRISYSLITLSACVALVKAFSKKIPITLIIASFFYFITGKYYINVIDNLHYPMTLLVLSIQILIINLNSEKKLIFLTSINILVASLFSWIACLTIISGVVLYYIAYKKNEAIKVGLLLIFVFLITIIGKLFLNASYLGYEIAYKELLFTIANRITGIPSYQDLKEFFAVNGIVLWGSQVQ